ncbi:NTP transferase domain-containing protein [Candidatus Sumerlaeota bacterium]|nr:NTP transferase domain-containing protein [Candidatus Sumerlaeota bacterium]
MRVVVIMAGGSGERFWPLSRKGRPKQLLALATDKPMLAEVAERACDLVGASNLFIVAGPHLEEAIREVLPLLPSDNLVIEPMGKNTAPCLALAAVVIAKRYGPDTVMGVLSADSLIGDLETFDRNVDLAFETAEREDVLVTLGIRPTHPDTGFGYLEIGPAVSPEGDPRGTAHRVESFREKPDEETARRYVESGQYLWNSGMFFWRIATLLKGLEQHAPAIASGAARIAESIGTDEYRTILREVFENWEKISIDYALMEKARNVRAVAGEFGWDDVGTWTALARTRPVDADGNLEIGRCLALDTADTILYNKTGATSDEEPPLLVSLGVQDLVVVHAGSAVLVCHRDRAQDIKQVLAALREKGYEQHL